MSDIPQERIDSMMVKCGRRCCICRRFRPTRLQVHHIVERNAGGTDDEDNMIVICFSCHTDVHTKVPFARRFSVAELKGHRDAVIMIVAEGTLPSGDTDDTDEVITRLIQEMREVAKPRHDLLPEAVEILTKAVNARSFSQGQVAYFRGTGGCSLQVGEATVNLDDQRRRAKYQHALGQLQRCGLLEKRSELRYDVTYDGYLAADEILAGGLGLLQG